VSSKRFALPVAAVALLVVALPAAAHVTDHSSDARSGGDDAEIVYRVPTEETSATTKVEIALPADTPIAGVYAESKPGWKLTLRTSKLATPIVTDDGSISSVVSDVTWTATAGGIAEGGYEDFTLAAGHLPDAERITFKAVQTYASGAVVRWIETGDDSDHPAPVLELTAAPSAPSATASPSVTRSAAPAAPAATGSDSTAKALGGAGLGVAVLALLLAVGALVRSGRSPRA
jgi:uncharacterized protein YcnI